MAKSVYADQFTPGIPILKDIQDKQTGRLARANARDREATLEEWNDLAKAEAAVKERYRGRYLFELLQNANDAIVDAGEPACTSELDARVRLELTSKSLLIANCGQPFGEANVRALCRLHNTTKSASKQIGHKGVGFKSVLEITGTPEVYSDIFAFKYDGAQFGEDVRQIMGVGQKLDAALPTLRTPYPCYLNQLNRDERDRIERLLDDEFVTVVRLPWDDETTASRVEARIKEDIQPSLLLFMTAIQRIELALPDGSEHCLRRDIQTGDNPHLRRVLLYRDDGGEDIEDSCWMVIGPIERPLTNRELVRDLGEAWQEVTAVRFALAIPLDKLTGHPIFSTESKPFYVYFPTQESSGLQFIVHADFYVGDDRKTLPTVPLNAWLTEEICGYLADEGMALLKKGLSQGLDLIDLLAPINRPERPFSKSFIMSYMNWLRDSPFIPIDGSQYKEPCNTRFPPRAANQDRFRAIFPAAKLRGTGKWAYATPDVIKAENGRVPPFILSNELGGEEISQQAVIDSLARQGMPPVEQSRELLAFLADWWADLSAYEERPAFQKLVGQLPVFPTGRGWLRPGDGVVFQANLRPGVPDIITPPGFDFAIIRRDAYSEAGYRSNEYRFFTALGARDYSARDLIRDAILPVLTSPERFSALVMEHPDSVLAVYELLFQYYRDERGSGDLADRLARVPVPAWQKESQTEATWKTASECYLGRVWPGGAELEAVYLGFDDCSFVRNIPGLECAGEDERIAWAGFLEWLGAMARPKIVSAGRQINGSSTDPFGDSDLWCQYLAERREDFICTNTGTNHGEQRYLTDIHTLHHFRDLVASGDVTRLQHLYHLLAANWMSHYHRLTKATVRCAYERCPRHDVEDYFLFALRHLPWLEATLGSNRQLLAACEIWALGETEPQDVRSLVPTPAVDPQQSDSRELRAALGFMSSGTAQVEDYVRLLDFLVTRYPRTAWSAELAERSRRNPLTTTFNWVLERVQTGLVARGNQPTHCPEALKLLALGQDGLDYVARDDPRLVYPDDPFLEARWQQHCAYLLANDDWRRLREWLEVSNLSSVVEAKWAIGAEQITETRELKARFNAMLPFFLALVLKRQPSVYERILPRLRRLDLHVVDSLTARETISRLPETVTISAAANAYLRLNEETRIRAGELFCTREVLGNPDILGDYVAGYIEIAGLGDAFILLMERDQDARERFVNSKGVIPELLRRARADLDEMEPTAESAAQFVSAVVEETLSQIPGVTSTQQPGRGDGIDGGNQSGTAGTLSGGIVHVPPKSYDPLDLDAAVSPVEATEHPAAKPVPVVSRPGGGNTTIVVTAQETKEALGKRGERWAYESEKRRLIALGFDPESPEYHHLLEWVSDKNPASNYDIRSVDDDLNEVYIEVKSSSDRARVIQLSLTELEWALQKGERYWLYWVGNAATAQPDPPEYYRDFARWLREKKVTVDIDSLLITLRAPSDAT